MKVTGKTVDELETSVSLDLFEGRKLPARVRDRVQDEVGNYLVEQTLISMEKAKSPVQGEGAFTPLSPAYAELKKRDVGHSKANLEFDGDLKDQLDFKATKTGIDIGFYGDRAPAADGHNNLSGKSPLPRRRSLPDEGQKYTKEIMTEIDRIIADAIAEETGFNVSDFKGMTTASEVYELLQAELGLSSRREVNLAVIRTDDLQQTLKEAGVYDLLKF